MGFFSRRKDENNGFIINPDDTTIKISGTQNLAPHAMTPDEVAGLWVFGDDDNSVKNTGALDSLKRRMNVAPQTTPEKVSNVNTKEPKETAPKTPETKTNDNNDDVSSPAPVESSEQKTLMEKVKRYTVDEQGHDVSQNKEPLYKLESITEILKNDSEDAIKNLSMKYGLDFFVDDLGKSKPVPEKVEEPKQEPLKTPTTETTPTPAFEKMVSESEEREAKAIYESLFPSEKTTDTSDFSVPHISDIDTHEVGVSGENNIANTATIRFTPVKNVMGNTDHITISNVTRHIDLGDNVIEDISSHSSPQLEQTEFDEFEPKTEFCDISSGKKILRSLAKKIRSYFVSAFLSFISLVALLIFLLPPLRDFIIRNPRSAMITCSAFLFVAVAANINMFFDFKNLFKKCCGFDIILSLCSLLTLTLGIVAALNYSDAYLILLLCNITIFIRSVCKFKFVSAQRSSLKQILNDKTKKAVTLINDPATTFAMAKNSIDGDVLAASYKNTSFVEDFMKHFEFYKTMSGKASLVFYVTLIAAVVCGLTAYFQVDSNNGFYAFYSAACISCFAAIPSAFFIDAIPFVAASKKLNPNGAMISGIYGAEKIEMANAVTTHTSDIFPAGAITMQSMRVLSDNNIDQILMRAASLTESVNSPLAPIFKQIAGTSDAYSIPDSDTVKYEKNLGISGWVDNEPLFIGNRSLMKAHGIEIPSLEIDKKILRKGYFPVYVATTNTACALVVIQYNVLPSVAKELHKITNLGVTLLVDNCDPNVTEEMICDYFGLYNDSLKIMSNAGVHMYKNAVLETPSCSSPASFRGNGLDFIKIINRASGIKRCNRCLTVMYVLFAILGALYFIYAAFSGLMSIPEPTIILLYALGTTVLSIIGFLIRKP